MAGGLIWDRHGNLGQASWSPRHPVRAVSITPYIKEKKRQFTSGARSICAHRNGHSCTAHTFSSAHKRTGRPHRCLSKAPHSHQGSRRPPKAHSQFIIHATRHSLRSHWWHEASPEPSASAARRLAPNRFSAPVASPPHARISEIPVRNRDQRRNRRRDALCEMHRSG